MRKLRFQKPQVIPLLFIIIATITLTSLGVWQVARLQWKNALVGQMETAVALPALGTLPQNTSGLLYRRAVLTGHFIYDKTLHMIGRQEGNEVGYFMVTPFSLEDDGRIVLVNRGFSPLGKESRPEGTVSVQGIVREPRAKRLFAPDNRADKNVWFYEDMPAMSAYTKLDLLPIVIEATGARTPNVYPIPSEGKIAMRNDHLGYAITWFSLAIIGVIMFGFYLKKEDCHPEQSEGSPSAAGGSSPSAQNDRII